MRAVVQRASQAEVTVEGKVVGSIAQGVVVLLGIVPEDTMEDVLWLCSKICRMRIFADATGVMNLSLAEVRGQALIISQFTLHASTKKGNRPSYIRAARPDHAEPLYEAFLQTMAHELGSPVERGIFGAMMQVQLTNDGPVTILLDTKDKE